MPNRYNEQYSLSDMDYMRDKRDLHVNGGYISPAAAKGMLRSYFNEMQIPKLDQGRQMGGNKGNMQFGGILNANS